MKKKLVMVFLAVAFAFTAQAATIRWQWQNATQSMAEFLGAYSGNALSPNAVAYLIVGTPFTDDSGIMNAVADGTFAPIQGGYDDRIICTQPVAAFLKGTPGPFPGSYLFSTYTSKDSAYLDGLGPTIHGLYMIVVDGDGDMYDYYTFHPKVPGDYSLTSAQYFAVTGYFPDVPAIPEPATALLALVGAATLLLRRRGFRG